MSARVHFRTGNPLADAAFIKILDRIRFMKLSRSARARKPHANWEIGSPVVRASPIPTESITIDIFAHFVCRRPVARPLYSARTCREHVMCAPESRSLLSRACHSIADTSHLVVPVGTRGFPCACVRRQNQRHELLLPECGCINRICANLFRFVLFVSVVGMSYFHMCGMSIVI